MNEFNIVSVYDILRGFEKYFRKEEWKIYSSTPYSATLIENSEQRLFYVIIGYDSKPKTIPLKRVLSVASRFSVYKGRTIHRIVFLARGFSEQLGSQNLTGETS